ncbi:MAG: type II toxin-antitoxin system YafQ family toxin [Bacilli bacterium]|nr:type II toxin-antitoxin system YafQ family toxin [Bacilli bacterium]
MSKQVIWTTQFKKDYKNAMKRGLPIDDLDKVIRILASDSVLPEKYRDHELSGGWKGFRECHIQPDWLLIYKITNNNLILSLSRTGSHSDLFK